MGKTLTILAYLRSVKDDSDGKPLRTLIILPASLLNQWVGEIEKRFRKKDLFKYHAYHGPKRREATNLQDNDIVFTTYEIVSREMYIFDKDGNVTVPTVSLCMCEAIK